MNITSIYVLFAFSPLHFVRNAEGGVEFQDRCHQHHHDPLAVEDGVKELRIAQPFLGKGIDCIHHRDAGKDKEDVGYILDALQAMDDRRLALVGLHRLDHAEEHGAQKEHPARGFHQPRINLFQHKAARTDNHQHAAQQKQSTLYFIQLFHLSYFLFLFVHTFYI